MTDLIEWSKIIQRDIQFQELPSDQTLDDITPQILDSIEEFYVMAGQQDRYSEDLVVKDEEGTPIQFLADFKIDEKKFILVATKIKFFNLARSSVDFDTGYSTDAMSVSNRDKPFANLTQQIAELQGEYNKFWHKMTRYNMLED